MTGLALPFSLGGVAVLGFMVSFLLLSRRRLSLGNTVFTWSATMLALAIIIFIVPVFRLNIDRGKLPEKVAVMSLILLLVLFGQTSAKKRLKESELGYYERQRVSLLVTLSATAIVVIMVLVAFPKIFP